MKITTTRLGELTKQGIVTKTEEENYKITTKAITQLQRDVPSRVLPGELYARS